MNQETFAEELLAALNIPATRLNIADIMNWEQAEGGLVHKNPLNTTQVEPGATNWNSTGVKTYTSWQQAINATVTTLNNGLYSPILLALRRGGTKSFGKTVASTPWGTGNFAITKMPKTVGPARAATIQSAIVAFAEKFLGKPYVYGGSGPNNFDCSGLTQYVYKQFGINLPHSATAQSRMGKSVSLSHLQAGDLLFYEPGSNGYFGHVVMYIGANKIIEAPHTGANVKVLSLAQMGTPSKAVRILNSKNSNTAKAKASMGKYGKGQEAAATKSGGGLSNPLSGLSAIGDFFSKLTSKATWVRVGKVAGGGFMVAVGLYLMTKETDIRVPTPMESVAGTVPGVKTAAKFVATPKEQTTTRVKAFADSETHIHTTHRRNPFLRDTETSDHIQYERPSRKGGVVHEQDM